ncbi:MAG TPA: hypothetical protein VF848_00975 [Steroidobacteraceae bacterium]
MVRLLIIGCAALVPGLVQAEVNQQLDWTVDVRAVSSDGEPSELDGGMGALRFGSNQQGLRLGLLRLGYRADLADLVHFDIEAVSYGDHAKNLVDLTEAYAEVRPLPFHGWRSRLKLGAFYPDISLEDRLAGWRSPYTLSNSAINTWVGEEIRTIGAQYSLDWLGRQMGHDFDAGVSAGVFSWNEPAGTVLAAQGWNITDRQSTLFSPYGAIRQTPVPPTTEFYSGFDHAIGFDFGLNANYRGWVELKALHYDNRADPSAFSADIQQFAWRTKFDSAGVRVTPTDALTVIAQYMNGMTAISPGGALNLFNFRSEFALVSYQHSAERFSLRFDRFDLDQPVASDADYGIDDGHAWTLAYQHQFDQHWNAVLEEVLVVSNNNSRFYIGLPSYARESQLQLAIRYEH